MGGKDGGWGNYPEVSGKILEYFQKIPGNFPDLMDICPIIENDILKRQINIFINDLQKMNPEIIPDPPVE